jgi:hypothetical protein
MPAAAARDLGALERIPNVFDRRTELAHQPNVRAQM